MSQVEVEKMIIEEGDHKQSYPDFDFGGFDASVDVANEIRSASASRRASVASAGGDAVAEETSAATEQAVVAEETSAATEQDGKGTGTSTTATGVSARAHGPENEHRFLFARTFEFICFEGEHHAEGVAVVEASNSKKSEMNTQKLATGKGAGKGLTLNIQSPSGPTAYEKQGAEHHLTTTGHYDGYKEQLLTPRGAVN